MSASGMLEGELSTSSGGGGKKNILASIRDTWPADEDIPVGVRIMCTSNFAYAIFSFIVLKISTDFPPSQYQLIITGMADLTENTCVRLVEAGTCRFLS